MRNIRLIEFFVGLFIIAAVVALFFLAFQVSGIDYFKKGATYSITADFDNIGGLQTGASVALGGVNVGKVIAISLNPTTLRAKVTMAINSKFDQLPEDSSASIMTHGILGSNYIGLSAGFATSSLHAGSEIADTHSALILENVIGQLLFSLKDGTSK